MHAKLVVVGGDAKAAVIRLKLPAVVGRGRNASLTLPHPLVSRQHCEIVESDGKLLVRDLGSLNGTFVGRERITEAILPPGELLTIGAVTFRAVYDEPAADPGHNGASRTAEDNRDSTGSPPDEAEPADGDSFETEPMAGELDNAPADEAPAVENNAPADELADELDLLLDEPDSEVAERPSPDSDDDVHLLHDDSLEELHLGEAPDEDSPSTLAEHSGEPASADMDRFPGVARDDGGEEVRIDDADGPLDAGTQDEPSPTLFAEHADEAPTLPSQDVTATTPQPSSPPHGAASPAERAGPTAEDRDEEVAEAESETSPEDNAQRSSPESDEERDDQEPAEDLDDDLRSFLKGFQ
jgi:hypothetical protein